MTSKGYEVGPTIVLGDRRQWGNLLLNTLFVCLLLLGVFVWRYLIPRVEDAFENLGQAFAAAATYAGAVANGAMDEAYALVVADPIAQEVLGEPITFARLEDVEWLPSDHEELAFAIPATGSHASGRVYCRVQLTSDGPIITSLELADESTVRRLFAWPQLPDRVGNAKPD